MLEVFLFLNLEHIVREWVVDNWLLANLQTFFCLPDSSTSTYNNTQGCDLVVIEVVNNPKVLGSKLSGDK